MLDVPAAPEGAGSAPEGPGGDPPSTAHAAPRPHGPRDGGERYAEPRVAGQMAALEMAVSGASIHDVLNRLVRAAQELAGDEARTILFMVDAAGGQLRFAASAGMPRTYVEAVDGIAIGPASPSCGAAAYRGEAVIVRDVADDPTWAPYMALAREHGIRACWSFPIRSFGRALGTMAVYHRTPREPARREMESMELLARTAALIIERHQDAEERRWAEEALRTSEERLRLTLQAAELGIWEHDLAAGLFFLDSGARHHYAAGPAITLDELVARVHPDDRPRLAGEMVAAMDPARRAAVATEYRVVRPDGEVRWLRIQGRVEFTGEGPDARAVRGLGAVEDVTERRRADEERERLLGDAQAARAEAEAANRAKAEFLASMSHELRTPLNAIGGYVELLDMGIHGPLRDPQRAAIGRITANQRHLLALINDILSFARLEAGRMEFDLGPLPVAEMLSSVESLVAPQAEARGVAYTVETCAPAELAMQGDAERVRQILLNLVGNAIKFTPAGGWVILSCHADGEWVYARVRDNGPGIPPEEQERIFDPFQQVGRRLNQPREGVGLGLAISRDLARGMAGDLTVCSTPGEGSTFILRLPRAVTPDPAG